ncbi:hypothetical protein ZIOFF_057441 [Zingiber officinale]|uniref:Uncharacterized protein n=1 Tax=Zingiber officinale TaxID=94328 RepID=A0A8J5F7L2_ZINOF|nr:hypothetical protein ZIOFF_057441 [Zingiber officinale]
MTSSCEALRSDDRKWCFQGPLYLGSAAGNARDVDNITIASSPREVSEKGPAYVDKNCTYFAGKEFVDFGSVDWGSVLMKRGISDLSQVLVFFDDPQNELKRLKQALTAGFQHLILRITTILDLEIIIP